MTMSSYSSAIVDVMLGWLKGLANWVLRLFNLAGSVTASPLLWLSQNWLKLLIFFLIVGVVLDSLIWLIRWRPYWVWFKKERVIVNDDKFFNSADMDRATSRESELEENWDEHDYVVASTVVRRRADPRGARADSATAGRAIRRPGTTPSRGRVKGTKVPKRIERAGSTSSKGKRDERRAGGHSEGKRRNAQSRGRKAPDSIFDVRPDKPDVSDFYEDEVFNVANLPTSSEFDEGERSTGE